MSRRGQPRAGPGRIILGWTAAYALVLAVLALTGYEDAETAVWLPVGGLVGYVLVYLASRSPGRQGEFVANLFFFAGLVALMTVAVIIAVSSPAEDSAFWMGILGFVLGVVAAGYVRLKYPPR